jgi:hypothetical protein
MMCGQGRPEETSDGVRFYAGEVSDAYLRHTNIQRGLTVVVWRGRHVAEPTELSEEEASRYWRDVLIADAPSKTCCVRSSSTTTCSGTRSRICIPISSPATRTTLAPAGRFPFPRGTAEHARRHSSKRR